MEQHEEKYVVCGLFTLTEHFIWDRKLCFSRFANFSRGLLLPNNDQSLIPRMCFRPVTMDPAKSFSVILKHCVAVVKGRPLSQN